MSDDQKKVFLSYRRALSAWMAHSVFRSLKGDGYDVFMDVESLDSGEFPEVILHQIEARPHFLIVLVPGSLERAVDKGDWLRREIEHALQCKRNIVPLIADRFTFDAERQRVRGKSLPESFDTLSRYNGIEVPLEYFDAAMTKLRDRFMKKQVKVSLTPTPVEEDGIVARMLRNAELAETTPSSKTWRFSTRLALPAPELRKSTSGSSLTWMPILGAMGYILQKSRDESFTNPTELYNGDGTEYPPHEITLLGSMARSTTLPLLSKGAKRYRAAFDADALASNRDLDLSGKHRYRVKARGGFAFDDSPWSAVFTPVPLGPFDIDWNALKLPVSTFPELEAPVLERNGTGWKWSAVTGAFGYLLESSLDPAFLNPSEVYKGMATECPPPASAFEFAKQQPAWRARPPAVTARKPGLDLPDHWSTFTASLWTYYRVKARGIIPAADGPWSNVIKV